MAGATARLALPYPTGTDTPDVPRDLLALANKLEAVVQPATFGLPAAPYDGQVAYLAPVAGVTWAFRYNAAGGAYKWEFMGGPPLFGPQGADLPVNPTTSGVWADDAATPTLTAPRAGDYEIGLGAYLVVNSGPGTETLSMYAWYTPPAGVLTNANVWIAATLPNGFVEVTSNRKQVNIPTAGSVVKLRASGSPSGSSVTFNDRWLTLLPRRVA